MIHLEDPHDRLARIGEVFDPLIGQQLKKYQCVEFCFGDDGRWQRWDDMPLRLFFNHSTVVSIAWTKFDEIFVVPNYSLPSWCGAKSDVRWVDRGIPGLDRCFDRPLKNVLLGRGEMTIGAADIEIWIRLLLEFEDAWFEIYNALNQNGYLYHEHLPKGEFHAYLG